jgi:hypothetical protein
MSKNWLLLMGVIMSVLVQFGEGNTSAAPIWVSSSFFKAGMIDKI